MLQYGGAVCYRCSRESCRLQHCRVGRGLNALMGRGLNALMHTRKLQRPWLPLSTRRRPLFRLWVPEHAHGCSEHVALEARAVVSMAGVVQEGVA